MPRSTPFLAFGPATRRFVFALLLGAPALAAAATPVDPRVTWGRERVEAALSAVGFLDDSVTIETTVAPQSPALPESVRHPEGFRLQTKTNHVVVTGYDAAGVLYGCLEAAARIKQSGGLDAGIDTAEAPAMTLRGPGILLMKLGSYNYAVTPGEFPFFYDRTQWIRWLDFMAAQRFNFIDLWNGHPFDYFVKFDRFAEAQNGMPPGLIERNHAMLRWLVDEAGRRNIRVLFEFYNIHTSVYFQRAHQLPDENRTPTPLLRDYTAYAVEKFVHEFPEIGYHITPGEAINLAYTDTWVNDVLLPAMKRGGLRGPVWVRAWGTDLEHARKIAAAHPEVNFERKYNVEMIASPRANPENRDCAGLTGQYIVNIHMAANLAPFRWSPPDYIRRCVLGAIETGATGLHLYPRKSWRWPHGAEPALPLVQWERDWSWYEAWGRYAWDPQREPAADHAWWINRLTDRFGDAEAAAKLFASWQAGADVLPALQRLIWLGDSNHSVLSAGILLSQLETATGIPFLDLPEVAERIPVWLDTLRSGHEAAAPTPLDFVDQQVKFATAAAELSRQAATLARTHRMEMAAWAVDDQAVVLVTRFYRQKMAAAQLRAQATAPNGTVSEDAFLAPLADSVATFEELADLLRPAYDSLSDVPAWHPARLKKVPFHWTDIVPLLKLELDVYRRALHPDGPPPSRVATLPGLAGLQFGNTDWKRVQDSDPITALNFHWLSASSGRGRSWSGEWRGSLIPPCDGELTLRVRTDQEIRLEVRSEPAWDGASVTGTHDLAIKVKRDQPVPLRIRYNQPLGDDTFLSITWSTDGTAFVEIPFDALKHSESDAGWAASAVLLNQF